MSATRGLLSRVPGNPGRHRASTTPVRNAEARGAKYLIGGVDQGLYQLPMWPRQCFVPLSFLYLASVRTLELVGLVQNTNCSPCETASEDRPQQSTGELESARPNGDGQRISNCRSNELRFDSPTESPVQLSRGPRQQPDGNTHGPRHNRSPDTMRRTRVVHDPSPSGGPSWTPIDVHL